MSEVVLFLWCQDNEMKAFFFFFSLAAVNTIEKKYFSPQYCVKTHVKVLQVCYDIKDLTSEEKKRSSMQETEEPRNKF